MRDGGRGERGRVRGGEESRRCDKCCDTSLKHLAMHVLFLHILSCKQIICIISCI